MGDERILRGRGVRDAGTLVPELCVFCGCDIADQAEGFMTHMEEDEECRAQWKAWNEFLQEDWLGE